jgi:hypothetical protein
MQKWEIAGISMLPVVELVLMLNGQMGTDGQPLVDPAIILQVVAAVATLAAIVRAALDKRKALKGE